MLQCYNCMDSLLIVSIVLCFMLLDNNNTGYASPRIRTRINGYRYLSSGEINHIRYVTFTEIK